MSMADQIERSRAANAGKGGVPIPSRVSGLSKYDAACRAVADAKSVDEVKAVRNEAEAMRAYAKQAKNRQLEIDASEIRLRAERRIGELMAAQRDAGLMSTGGRPSETGLQTNPVSAPPSLAEVGIDKNLADRARKYAAIPDDEFEGILAQRRDRLEQEDERVTVDLMSAGEKHVRGTFGTGENEWYTPREFIDRARLALGEIDLDPASSEAAQVLVGATRYFTELDDGLSKEWAGRVWLNPPYAQPAIQNFADKVCAEWVADRIEAAIVLTHNYTDTTWFQQLARHSRAICFTRGRVKFVSPTGELAAPTQGQAFFYIGPDVSAFEAAFADVGFIVRLGAE